MNSEKGWKYVHVCVCVYIYIYVAQLAAAVEYTESISEERLNTCNESSGYDIKQSDSKASALEICGLWSTCTLPLFPGPLWLGVVALDRVLSVDWIEQTMCK